MSHSSIDDAAPVRATHTGWAAGCAIRALGCLLVAAIATTATMAKADPRRHHEHRPPYRHGHGAIFVHPVWPRYAPPPVYAPPPHVVFHRHHGYGGPPPWMQCRAWQGPIWTGYRFEHVYGTICLMPDGTWQLVG